MNRNIMKTFQLPAEHEKGIHVRKGGAVRSTREEELRLIEACISSNGIKRLDPIVR